MLKRSTKATAVIKRILYMGAAILDLIVDVFNVVTSWFCVVIHMLSIVGFRVDTEKINGPKYG